ncbi:MAG: sugar phosphate isomerase/epimerase [Bryobacteraceae bacterium]|nr:sugar phosphate isomerase/epimerase [Bryobacteraceae bacterium]
MKFGVNTLLWTASFSLEDVPLLERIRQWGFDGVEIARYDFRAFPARVLREAVRNEGLEPALCSALTGELSLAAESAETRRAAADFLRRAIEAAAELGSSVLAGPFVSAVGLLPGRRPAEDEWKRAVEGVAELVPLLREHDVTLALEPLNRFETYLLNTCAEMRRFCDEVHDPYVGALFDTFHANIEEKCFGEAVRALGPRLQHLHACENDRGTPGTGHVAWDEVFAALRETGYDGWCVIESFGSRVPEIAAAACVWRDFAPDAETLAREGLAFLRDAAARAMGAAASAV